MEAEKKVQEPVRGPVTRHELTARWARAKVTEETGRLEAERLKAELLEQGVEIGFEDDYLIVGSRTELEGFSSCHVIASKKLENVLREEHCLRDAYETEKFSVQKVRALARINPKIQRVLSSLEYTAPVFRQASKKAK